MSTVEQCQKALAKIEEAITTERTKGTSRDSKKISALRKEHTGVTSELARALASAKNPKTKAQGGESKKETPKKEEPKKETKKEESTDDDF